MDSPTLYMKMDPIINRQATIFCGATTMAGVVIGELYGNTAAFMIMALFGSMAIILLIKMIEQVFNNVIDKYYNYKRVSDQLFYILMEECSGDTTAFFDKQYVRDIILDYIHPNKQYIQINHL
jgi:hypothetical protein